MLELKNICYTVSTPETGEQTILKDISVTIPDGKLIVFTGPNGGGKTTLAKVIMGLVTPTSGQILWNGEDITALDITARAKRGISYGFQQPPRFKGITVRDLSLRLGLYDSVGGLVLFHIAFQTGFCTFFMRNFIRDLPHELIEAARIEGASEWQIFWKVVLPLVRPALLSAALLIFADCIGEFALPYILGLPVHFDTLSTGLYRAIGTRQSGVAAVIATATAATPTGARLPPSRRPVASRSP